jgi:HD-like signal output (HDOD) protein
MSNAKEFEFIERLASELSSHELVFPTSLDATMKIRHALNTPDIPADKIARIVGAEPVVTAHVLKLCNSAAFNRGGSPISDLRKATMLLGLSMVRNVAISVGMKQLTQSRAAAEVPKIVDDLWKRCLRISALSFVIAKKLSQVNPETAMMAGLLLNIGKFYILNRAHEHAELFVDESALWGLVEQWHTDIGAAILESWNIPEDIRAAVLAGADANRSHRGGPDLADVVLAADFLDGKFYADVGTAPDWTATPHALSALHLDQEKSVTLMEESRDEVDLVFQALS